MRISTLLGIAVVMLPLAARADEPVQDRAHYEAAFRNHSTAPSFVLVTIVDDRTGQSRTGCVEANFVMGAITFETGVLGDEAEQTASSNSTHVFHFSKQKALDNVPFRYTQADLDRARDFVRRHGLDGLLLAMKNKDPELGDLRWSAALACVLIENGLSAVRGDIPANIFAGP
jgi:hypothetical protein